MPASTRSSPLCSARRAEGLTQRQLSALASVSVDTVSLLERGATPQLRTAQALARALGVPVATIFPDETEPSRARAA